MKASIELTHRQLADVADAFQRQVAAALEKAEGDLAWMPTYLPPPATVPSKTAVALELGGTRMRAALVAMGSKGLRLTNRSPVRELPWQRGVALATETFFEAQASLLADLNVRQGLPLGYCFSYPAAPQPDGDARCLRWTKDIRVPELQGRLIGAGLRAHLARRPAPVEVARVRVINDTVAGLLAGSTLGVVDALVSVVVGTGFNLAACVDPGQIARCDPNWQQAGDLPVNLEAGNFDPPVDADLDRRLDERSSRPGAQRFEKMISGLYLPRLLQLACPQGALAGADQAKAMVRQMDATRPEVAAGWARQLVRRSARLVAAALAGLIWHLDGLRLRRSVRIVADGGLLWSSNRDFSYQQTVAHHLKALLADRPPAGRNIQWVRLPAVNLLGCAVAALTEIDAERPTTT